MCCIPANTGSLTLTDTADDSLRYSTKLQRDGSFMFPGVPSGAYSLAITDASISMLPGNLPAEAAAYAPLVPVNAFADASTSLIVGDSDILNATLTATEVPLPNTTAGSAPK